MEGAIRSFDAIVIGGGPAGSAAAGLLARRGRAVALLERQRFPRFHIGESLLPATNPILRELGCLDAVRAAGFVVKRGASFWTEDGRAGSTIDFAASREVAEPVTFQVPRARFDQLLLGHAGVCGAEVREGWRAVEARLPPGGGRRQAAGAVAILAEGPTGERETLGAEYLVDASGQAGFLSKQLGLRAADPRLRNTATHAQYEGIPRPDPPRAGDIQIISLRDLGWVWLIPLSEAVTSVGLVEPRRPGGPIAASAEALEGRLRAAPLVCALLASARRVSPVRRDADFSYRARRYVGRRWLLAGDAGSFLDPVFSTGVFLALESGRDAAAVVDACLAAGRPRRRALAGYARRMERRYLYFRRFVTGFYDPAFRDLFFQPEERWGLQGAVIAALAGVWSPSAATRLRLATFFALAALQRRLPFAPRYHGPAPEAPAAASS